MRRKELIMPDLMPDSNTEIVEKPKASESHFFSVSVRSWIVLILVGTICIMALKAMEVKEPLYSLVTIAVGYYFGQNTKPKSQGGTTQ